MTGPTALDLFCGAGGSSTGLAAAGVRVMMAANHWKLAVEVHQLNHPATDHDCADISAVDPRRYPATDLLWASPECTNHSGAKGVRRATGQGALPGMGDEPDPGAERSRATMWDVVRFAEAMLMRGRPYQAIVVENVVEAALWMFWDAWLAAMDAAGYGHRVVYLNSAFAHGRDYGWYGAPQYRDRIYVVFWRRGAPAPDLDIRPPGWCPRCEAVVNAVQAWKKPYERWGRWRAQYVYQCPGVSCRAEVEPLALPAATVIDWSDLGGRIGDRARPLATATRERIRAGLARYGRPIGLPVGGNTFERHPGTRVWPTDRPRPVVTATGEANALACPPLLVPAGGTWNDGSAPAADPFRTRTTRETEGLLCPPLLVPVEARDGLRARPAGEPGRTQTGRAETAFVVPPFLAPLRSGRPRTSGVDEPTATVVANGSNHALAVPAGFVMRNNNGRSGDGGEMCTPFDQPVRTVTTAGHQSLVTVPDALLVPYYGTAVAHHVGEPAGTVTTRDRHALVTRAPADVGDDEVDDCTFRMLTVEEIYGAMAFPPGYLRRGSKRDQVRMGGNAVTPPAARLLAERVLAALTRG